jgi:hypothetical protein
MNYVEGLRQRLRSFPNRGAPPPWKQVGVTAVGGLLAVGFAPRSDLLLAVSQSGRGLFDAQSAKCLARDDSEPGADWLSQVPYAATAIGVLGSATISLAGILGGGLARVTTDGWHLEVVSVDWPNHILFLEPPAASIFIPERSSSCGRIDVTENLRAAGFSPTGNSFVVATSSDLTFYIRAELRGKTGSGPHTSAAAHDVVSY